MNTDAPTTLDCAFGQFQLERFPKAKRNSGRQEPLRAWDAADEYLLKHVAELELNGPSNIAIINDGFGALAVALNTFSPQSLGDSYIAQAACLQNLSANELPASHVSLLHSLEAPKEKLDYLFIKVPRTLSLLEDQLYRLRSAITEKTVIVAAGMVKNIHNSTIALFEKIIGPTHTSLAKKKARLIFCQPQPQHWQGESPYPSYYPLENTAYTLSNHAAVFSRASLDIGTRLLLEHLPESTGAQTIIDMGCGNGVIGILTAEKNPNAKLVFTDESFMAVASAQENFDTIFGQTREAEFHVDNCLEKQPDNSAEVILTNPPFHQQSTIATHIARQMFSDSKRVLKQGGKLWVIANRHLGYEQLLKRMYGSCITVAANKKFVVLRATKR